MAAIGARQAGLHRLHLPPGARVGLLGGSFDPAHGGHAHITRVALARFALDRVVWLVSPGNPLKQAGPAALDARMAQARQVIEHPRITVSDIEARLGTVHTAATVAALQAMAPRVRFVWLMGADNLHQLDRWHKWREIMRRLPVGVLARPGWRQAALHSRAARIFRGCRIPARSSRALAESEPPAWCFINLPMMPISSTQIRASGAWARA